MHAALLRLIIEHRNAEAAEAAKRAANEAEHARAEAHRQRIAAMPDPIARVKAIAAAQAAARAVGAYSDDFAAIFERLGAREDGRGLRAGERDADRLNDLLHGRSTGRRFVIPHEGD